MNKGLKFFAPAAAAIVGLMASCGSSVVASSSIETTSTTSTTTSETTSVAPEMATIKAAHGYYAPYAIKAATARAPQLVQTDVDYVGVLLEDDGTILDLKIDVMQVKATGVDATTTTINGTVFPDTTDFKTKWDLLEDYNMNGEAGEWYEQALKIEQYAVGKNIETLISELNGTTTFGADVSITVDGFAEALVVASEENNYREFEVEASDVENLKLGIGMSSSHEAKRTNINIASVVFNGEEVLDAQIDVLQVPYTITAVGDPVVYEVGIDTTKAQVSGEDGIIMSKVTIQDLYGMGAISEVGEFYEQADSFELYVIGKTLDVAFAASALETGTHGLAFIDGAAIGVTIGVSDLIAVTEEAELISAGRVLPTV